MPDDNTILLPFQGFAQTVTSKMGQLTHGEPEEQLRSPFEVLMGEVGKVLSHRVVCIGETLLADRLGKPDYAVHVDGLLAGYVELKAPGIGATPSRFSGHNKEQWKRFQALPNILYSDGSSWGLYRDGKAARPLVRLSGDVATEGRSAVAANDARALSGLLRDFFAWQPIIPRSPKGLADLLAPLCRMLRDDVADALKHANSPLLDLARDWRHLLFPEADDQKFADAYAQTVTFALLLARSEGAEPLSVASAEAVLGTGHSLLSRALGVLTDPGAQAEISASLNLLVRVIGEVPPQALHWPADPWLYFYEHFLATYDPKLRKNAGAYYTPVEVVHAQVRLVDDLLENRLGKPLGFADPDVVTLDPAVGTGTYLLGVIDHTLAKMEARQGPGAVPGHATALAKHLYGFESMVGPFAVSELRVSRALTGVGAQLPQGGSHIYLTDTLESPTAQPPQLGFYLQPIADQHRRALEVKANVPVIVCLGNPPYDRHQAADDTNRAQTGNWVRWGDSGDGRDAIFKDFVTPARDARHGVHIKNLYNLYIYFWRWALWKVFEHETAAGPGVVSFITASSYIDGDAFCGLREHMRRVCDEIWIMDLGGEGRGTRQSENVFAIQTPVAIAIAARYHNVDRDTPAKVHFARISGDTRAEKLAQLETVSSFASLAWEDCADGWQAPFRPSGAGLYFDWPLLTDIFPWQHSGVQFKRTWPIGPDRQTLINRWRGLLTARNRAETFRESRDRKVSGSYPGLFGVRERQPVLGSLPAGAPAPVIRPYGYRSFDRQWILADSRLGDFLRPDLWASHSDRQIYLTSLLTKPIGIGPAVTACSALPDLDHFSGRGAKDVVPLYRDAQATEPNVLPGLLETLSEALGLQVTPEDFLAYVYGTLAQPGFTRRYAEELETRELRVPITKDAAVFAAVREKGARLLWLNTYGERFVPNGHKPGDLPRGDARSTRPVPGDAEGYPESYSYDPVRQTLRVGTGEFSPVAAQVYECEVSGLKVVQSWLKYRMKAGGGRKSSPLDDIRPKHWTIDFTTELLELLWVLEATVSEYAAMEGLLDAVVQGPCFRADELPPAPPASREPPSAERQTGLFTLLEER